MKKLETTDFKERLKRLIDGETFLCDQGGLIRFNPGTQTFMHGITTFYGVGDIVIFGDWYYPPKTYTINGIELEDNRVKRHATLGDYYMSSTEHRSMYKNVNCPAGHVIDRGLVHTTKESAIAHAKAMMGETV